VVAWLVGALGWLVAGACTGVAVEQRQAPELAQLRSSGFRIAVVPLRVSAPADGFLSSSLAPVGQLFALEGGGPGLPDRAQVGAVLRSALFAWLAQGEFEVVEPWVSDTQLAHAGLSAVAMGDPANVGQVCRVLSVDGVLYGDVTAWNRSYYLVQSTAEVGLRLELRAGTDGRTLFFSDRRESVGSGLTGGPTGFVSAATEPLAGLRSSHLQELLRSVARSSVADLNGGALDGTPGPMAPRLSVVGLARPHAGGFVPGERIEVIAVGTPDCDVRFDLGRLRTGVPMQLVARHPDPRGERATYQGHYVVQSGEQAEGLPVFCTIARTSRQHAQASRYRWSGTVDLGAQMPAAPARAAPTGSSAE
jgi:hypothetical protein